MKRVLVTLIFTIAFAPHAYAWDGPNDGLPNTARVEDVGTPRAALTFFLTQARSGDYTRAAAALDLRGFDKSEQVLHGPELAKKLAFLINRYAWTEEEDVSDDPDGNPEDGARRERLQPITARGIEPAPVELQHVQLRDGDRGWVFSRKTLARVPELYDDLGPVWIEPYLPAWSRAIQFLGVELWQWIGLLCVLLLAPLIGRVLGSLFVRVATRIAQHTKNEWDDDVFITLAKQIQFLIAILAARALIQPLALTNQAQIVAQRAWLVLLVLAIGRMTVRLVDEASRRIELRAESATGSSVLHLRAVRTQFAVLRRVTQVAFFVLFGAMVLMQFEAVRNIGVSLLASAGIAGIVLGVAAQKSIGTLLAGIQMSVTQPIRISDKVVVEGEFGTVEEISLTYVVVQLWDDRRLIVPMQYFLDKPFQNWTRKSLQLLGEVLLQADYSVPVDQVREELKRYVESHELWDRRTVAVQVTKASEATIELRALVSAADSGKLFDLRCDVREHLVNYLKSLDDGRYLPRRRVEERAPNPKALP